MAAALALLLGVGLALVEELLPPQPAAASPRAITAIRQREVLLLRFVDGLSLAEIAEAMDIPLGTVKSRLHNALQTLRQDERTRNFFER